MEAVRPAEAGDLDRCRDLLTEAIAATDGQRGAALWLSGQVGDELVSRWSSDPDSALVVGTYDDVIVGVAAGTVGTLGGRHIGRIECFYVEPDARAVGVGQAIVEYLVQWFARRDCLDVDAMALPGDRSSKQLLESSGFKARLLILHRSLG
ncbi:MAG: GNAT family N-acetyltransferase [Acidimicrobiales bacterium]